MLNEGELICDECEGTGYSRKVNIICFKCPKCDGKGKLDWVTNAMGNSCPLWGEITLKSYNGAVFVDCEGESGTTYPIGTLSKPVNNLADARKIAKERGL